MSDVRVVSLRGEPIGGQVNDDIVAWLESALDQAKRGEIDGLAVAVSRPNDKVDWQWIFGSNGFRLLAAISIMQHEAVEHAIELGSRPP